MSAIFTAPATVSHPEVVAYVSLSEYANAPTGVDTTALVPTDPVANGVELANVIRRASAWANNLCHQILAATLDVQTASNVRVRRDGTVHVACDFWPVLEVDSFAAGYLPSQMNPVIDFTDMWLNGRKVLVVPVSGLVGAPSVIYPGSLHPGSRAYCQWSYWNGWVHSTLAAGVDSGVSTLPLATAVPAAAAGMNLTIPDGGYTEVVQVAAGFTGGTSLPLVAPTAYPHQSTTAPASTTVTALPDDVRHAVISLTSALIKTRGAESYEMGSVGEAPSRSEMIEGGGMEDLSVAVDLLDQYQRVA